MGRSLQFALTILVVYIFEIGSALWVAIIIGNKITELFNQINKALIF